MAFGEGGQALVEAALVLPLLLVMVLAAVEFTYTATNKAMLTHAAYTGAYKAAVTHSCDSGENAARVALLELKQSSIEWQCWSTGRSGDDVRVILSYPYSLNLLFWHKAGRMNVTVTDVNR